MLYGLLPTSMEARTNRLLIASRVANAPLPVPEIRSIDGGNVSYVTAGRPDQPLILYFHGWGDDYRVVLPLEYPLLDAGFRILVMHRGRIHAEFDAGAVTQERVLTAALGLNHDASGVAH